METLKIHRKCMYNVTFSRVRVIIFAVEKQYALNRPLMNVCLYSRLTYPACIAHFFYISLYCHLCPVCFYHIFQNYLIKGAIKQK
jgi:hypothetical protein